MSKRNKEPSTNKTGDFFMVKEYQKQKNWINYNNCNEVTSKIDNMKGCTRVITHTENFHCKNKSRQQN
jgi:hypothetical protein